MNILADVAAGGDRDKLRKMMEQGQVDVYKYLPLVFEEMRKRAQIGLKEYYEKTLYQQRRVERANEAFLRTFMDAGAAEGMLAVYRAFAQTVEDSIPTAEWLGDAFRRAGHLMSAAILAPKEFFDWMRGKEKEGNFMTFLFGPSGESGFAQAVQYTFKQVENFVTASMEASRKSVEGLKNEFSVLNDIIAPLLEDIGKLLELGAAYQRGGISGLAEKNMQIENRGRARDIAEQEALDIYQRTGVKVPRADITSRADEIYRNLEHDRLNKPEERSWWQRYQFDVMKTGEEKGIVDPVDRIADWMAEGIKGLFSSPEVSPSPVSYSGDTSLGQTSPRLLYNLDTFESALLDRFGWLQMPPSTPFDETNLLNSAGVGRVELVISGNITVDGELGTMIDDTNLSEKFNEQIEQMLYGARPQFSVVHR